MNLSHPRRATWTAVLLIACSAIHATDAAHADDGATGTWRCGNTYTDQPCKDGKPLKLDDARDAAQKRASDSSAREARNTADRLERDRLRQESALARRRPILIEDKPQPGPPPKKLADARKTRKGRKDADYFSAYDPTATANKKAAKAARKKSDPQS